MDLRHPLIRLAQRMPWAALEDALQDTLPPAPVAGGRPALPVRLMERQRTILGRLLRDVQRQLAGASAAAREALTP